MQFEEKSSESHLENWLRNVHWIVDLLCFLHMQTVVLPLRMFSKVTEYKSCTFCDCFQALGDQAIRYEI